MTRPIHGVLTVVAILGACASGCSDSQTKPAPSQATLTGRIRLISTLFDLSGNSTGQRLVDDADGVRVHLETPGHGLDSTVTVHGQYQFTNLGAGTYRVSSWVLPAHPVRIPDIAVLGLDVSAPDTLVLGPPGREARRHHHRRLERLAPESHSHSLAADSGDGHRSVIRRRRQARPLPG